VDEGKGRIGLAVSYSNPDKAYALLDHRNKPKNRETPAGAAELYQTTDGGNNWKRTHTDELMIFDEIGWYFADVVVDPANDDRIYTLGVRLAHSSDGGKTFTLVGGDVYHLFPNPAGPLHLDQCEFWINPTDPNHLALANDGGFYVSHDRGMTWMHYNNIPTGEFYDITLDHRTPYTIYAGAQDDATVYGPGNEWIPKRYDTWKYLWIDPWSGGDGCVTVTDPLDSNLVYWSSQEGWIRRMDLRTRKSVIAAPSEAQMNKLRFNFISPYFLSSHSRSLYLGANQVMKSNDQGHSWTPASPDLTIGQDKSKNSMALGAVIESEIKAGLLYAGTDKGLFWVTLDGGLTWAERSNGLPSAYIRSISPSKYKESRVYLALSGINYDDHRTHLYKSEDYGKSWERISGDLPSEVAYVIKEDPHHENVLFAGLYRAVYISLDRGTTWSQFGKGMPSAAISDLEFDTRSGDMVLSTHGRGLYKMNLKPLYEWIDTGKPDRDQLFTIDAVRGPNVDQLPDDQNTAVYEKLPITFWRAHAGESTLSLTTESNKVVWSKTITTRKGFNQYRWDFVLQSHSSPLPYFTGAQEFVKPGRYMLRIEGVTPEANLTIED
ncbi:MAG: WD40/YVTN/BNR-like repeat-containing protein, partial [Bacteroidota bacterium]